MTTVLENILCAVLVVAAFVVIATADTANGALFGVGMLLTVGIYRIWIVDNQQRQQTAVLIAIAERQSPGGQQPGPPPGLQPGRADGLDVRPNGY